MNSSQLRELITGARLGCGCGQELHGDDLQWYPHSGGYRLDDDVEPQWYYLHCPRCKYDSALWKVAKELGEYSASRGVALKLVKQGIQP